MSEFQTVETQCESCGMPMSTPEQHGTEGNGAINGEYCRYCYRGGEFTVKASREEFIERQIGIAIGRFDMDEVQARTMATAVIPQLRRWRR